MHTTTKADTTNVARCLLCSITIRCSNMDYQHRARELLVTATLMIASEIIRANKKATEFSHCRYAKMSETFRYIFAEKLTDGPLQSLHLVEKNIKILHIFLYDLVHIQEIYIYSYICRL